MFLQAFLLHSVQYAYWLALALITFGFLQRIHQKRFVSIPGKILASLGALLLTISADGLFGSIAVAAQLFADLVPERSLGGYQVTSIFPAFGPLLWLASPSGWRYAVLQRHAIEGIHHQW